MNKITHEVPYLPKGHELYEVPAGDVFMARALVEVAVMERENPEANRAAASVIVKNGVVIGIGRNRSTHPTYCPRKALGSPTGQEYDLCPKYCHSDNHSESAAVRVARDAGEDTTGADLYLAGHWWACQPCWDSMIAGGIKNVFVAEGAKALYDDAARKDNPLAGKLKVPVRIYIEGAQRLEAATALARVNFTIVDDVAQAEVAMLLPGASDQPILGAGLTTYDYRMSADYRAAVACLAEDLAL
jgi:deoxycytidylate deaminase